MSKNETKLRYKNKEKQSTNVSAESHSPRWGLVLDRISVIQTARVRKMPKRAIRQGRRMFRSSRYFCGARREQQVSECFPLHSWCAALKLCPCQSILGAPDPRSCRPFYGGAWCLQITSRNTIAPGFPLKSVKRRVREKMAGRRKEPTSCLSFSSLDKLS